MLLLHHLHHVSLCSATSQDIRGAAGTENLARRGVRYKYYRNMQRSNIYKHHILAATTSATNQGTVVASRREGDQ